MTFGTSVMVLLALPTLFSTPSESSSSKSGANDLSDFIHVPLDSSGRPDYCSITKTHSACQTRIKVGRSAQSVRH
jgi:hypothetical protein